MKHLEFVVLANWLIGVLEDTKYLELDLTYGDTYKKEIDLMCNTMFNSFSKEEIEAMLLNKVDDENYKVAMYKLKEQMKAIERYEKHR